MRSAIVVSLVLAAAWLVTAARDAAPDFTDEPYFRFGMELSAADKTLNDTKNWEIGYRIDTPQTSEIACRYSKQAVYLLRFYQGRCYHLEKRADVPADKIDAVFSFYKQLFGDTPEASRSSQGDLYFARWTQRKRDIELTAYERVPGTYSVIYQEVDNDTEGEALRVQEQELESQPSEIDPVTGKPRPATHDQQQEQGQDGESQGQGEGQDQNGEQGKGDGTGPSDDQGKDEGKGDDQGGEGSKDDGDKKPPKHDDPGDW